jgi:hypothetical protein
MTRRPRRRKRLRDELAAATLPLVMRGRGSRSSRLHGRSRVARVSAVLAHRNRHLALGLWLITFVPLVGALAAHGYDRAHWRHWADIVFFCATGAGLAVAWVGEQAKLARR